jgi:hypothetical protein
MHVPVERFVGVLDDYTVLFLQTCEKCRILITYQGQGHQCSDGVETSEAKQTEAALFAQLMQRVKKLYVVPTFDAPRQ